MIGIESGRGVARFTLSEVSVRGGLSPASDGWTISSFGELRRVVEGEGGLPNR